MAYFGVICRIFLVLGSGLQAFGRIQLKLIHRRLSQCVTRPSDQAGG
jgi:hypothetical protein